MRAFNRFYEVDATILENPSETAIATWEWYESGEEDIPDNVTSFKQKGPRKRISYGPLVDKHLKRACHQVKTAWAGYKGVIQCSAQADLNLGKYKEICLQTVLLYQDLDNKTINATFMLAKMRGSQREDDFYTFYKMAQKASELSGLPLGQVHVFVAATQEKNATKERKKDFLHSEKVD